MGQDNEHFGTTKDGDGFKHGLDEDNAMTGEVENEAKTKKQVDDPDVDTRPAAPVEHTSNVVGRRNPDLPTSNLSTAPTSATDTAAAGS